MPKYGKSVFDNSYLAIKQLRVKMREGKSKSWGWKIPPPALCPPGLGAGVTRSPSPAESAASSVTATRPPAPSSPPTCPPGT